MIISSRRTKMAMACLLKRSNGDLSIQTFQFKPTTRMKNNKHAKWRQENCNQEAHEREFEESTNLNKNTSTKSCCVVCEVAVGCPQESFFLQKSQA